MRRMKLWVPMMAALVSAGGTIACDGGGGPDNTLRSAEVDGEDCTRTLGYWRNHNSHETRPNRAVPWPENPYFDEDTIFMDNGFDGIPGCPAYGTYLNLLETAPRGDRYRILARQYIPAKLNIFAGVEDEQAWALILEAFAIMNDCAIAPDEAARAREIADELDAFNRGEWGPGHCG